MRTGERFIALCAMLMLAVSSMGQVELRAWNNEKQDFFADRQYPAGQSVQLALYAGPRPKNGPDAKRIGVHLWAVKSNKSVSLFDAEAGVIETLGEGTAVIEAFVADSDNHRTYRFSVVVTQGHLKFEVVPKGLEKEPLVMIPGQSKALMTKLGVIGESRIVKRRMEAVSENESILSILGPDSKSISPFIGVAGDTFTIRANAPGDVRILAQSSNRQETVYVKVVMPELEVKLGGSIEQQAEAHVEANVTFPANTSFNFNDFFKAKLEITGGKVESTYVDPTGTKLKATVSLPDQGTLTAKLSILTLDDKPVKGLDPVVRTGKIKPKVHSLAIIKARSTVVRGDRFLVNVLALDHKQKEVPTADRGPLNVELTPAPPAKLPKKEQGHYTTQPSVPVVTCELTDKGDLVQIISSPFDGFCDLTLSLKSAPFACSTARIRLVEPVEVTARKMTSPQHVRDLIGHQAAREFDIYELTAINNLGQIEDPTNVVRGASINLLGETLLMPVELLRVGARSAHSNGSGETTTGINESSPEQIQQFITRGDLQSVCVFVPPVYSERFELVKDAVAHRDPSKVAQRFLEQLAEIATFMHEHYKSSHSNPFRGEGDAVRRSAAATVLNLWFNRHDAEVAKRGKLVSTSQFLTRSTSVPPDRPLTVFYLVPKDTWKSLEKKAQWQVNFFPVSRVRINYEVTIRTETTQAGRNGGRQ